ncbi:MAG: hypothetical protein IPL47_08360 [Phyllobacteriaceae bacterium]|nr:hypothetical protein [Phyllobacteriaceae bacterium]
MKKLLILFVGMLSACQTVNNKTVKDMPTAYLCDLLSPNFITTPSERKEIFVELEKKGARCAINIDIKKY